MISHYYQTLYDQISASDGIFYRHYGEERSYPDLKRRMLQFHSALDAFPTRRIAVYADKSLSNYAAILTILFTGRTWVPLNPKLPPRRIVDMLTTATPDMILTDQRLPSEIIEFAANSKIEIVELSTLENSTPSRAFTFQAIEPDDPAIILFTSGSTGVPKGVQLNHSSCVSIARTTSDVLPSKAGETIADYHDVGFVKFLAVLFPCLTYGGTLSPALTSEDLLVPARHIIENQISSIITVPSTIARLQRKFPKGIEGLNLNLVVMCGEPLHLDLLEYVATTLQPKNIVQFYGATEAGCVFSYRYNTTDIPLIRKIGLVPIGNPVAGVQARLNTDGELLISGPPVSVGYINDQSSAKFLEIDDRRWYRTGDVAEIHDEFYYCKGRLDHMVKVGGNRVELLEIEARLRQIDAVIEAICFVNEPPGRPSEIVAAVLADENMDVASIRLKLREWLPRYMMPKKFVQYSEFPSNKNGKVDRAAISAEYRDTEGAR